MDLQNGVDHSVLLDFTNDMAILSAALKRKRNFHLTEEETSAFRRITETELTKLVHPDWSKPFRVHTDASGHSISSILVHSGILGWCDNYHILRISKLTPDRHN